MAHTAYRQQPKYRGTIFERDDRTCQLCGATECDGVRLELDHIIPYAISHNSEADNLRVTCVSCNRATRRRRKDAALSLPEYMAWLRAEIATCNAT